LEIQVTILPEYTYAYISVLVEENEKNYDLRVEDLENALTDKGVIVGIRKDALKNICENKIINEKVLAAGYIKPQAGNDAKVEIIRKPKKADEVKPVKKENDEIDYYAPRDGFITLCREGEVLAIKTAPTRGEPGKNVLGKVIPGKLGKEISLDLFEGKNAKIENDKLIAECDGIVSLSGLLVNIETTYKIDENIGRATGSIDLPKDIDISLIINGDIQRGFSAKCNKLYVTGCIEDAEIDCNILKVKGGIVGIGEKPIKAELIYLGFINGERKVVGRIISVLREISSGAKVMGDLIKAHTIQGSSAMAKEAIWTNYINGKNSIMVGTDYKSKLEYDELSRKILEIGEPLEELKNAAYANAKRMKQLAELSKINPKHPLLQKELPKIKAIKEKLDKFEKLNQALHDKRVECEKNIYTEGDPFLLVKSGFSKDESSGMTVEPDTTIFLKENSTKVFESKGGGLFYISKFGVSSTARYNIKELRDRFDSLLHSTEETVYQSLPQSKKVKKKKPKEE